MREVAITHFASPRPANCGFLSTFSRDCRDSLFDAPHRPTGFVTVKTDKHINMLPAHFEVIRGVLAAHPSTILVLCSGQHVLQNIFHCPIMAPVLSC